MWRCRVYCNLNLLLLQQRALWKHSHRSRRFLRGLLREPAGCRWGWEPPRWSFPCDTPAWTTVCVWWSPCWTAAGAQTCPSIRAQPIGWRWRRGVWTEQTSGTGNWGRSSSGWWRTCRSLIGCCRGRGDVGRWSQRLHGERWTRSPLERERDEGKISCGSAISWTYYFWIILMTFECFHVLVWLMTEAAEHIITSVTHWSCVCEQLGDASLWKLIWQKQGTCNSITFMSPTQNQHNVLNNSVKNRHIFMGMT